DRPGCGDDRPRAEGQKRAEEQCFDRKMHVVLAREKIPREPENKSSAYRSRSFYFRDRSLDCDYAHVRAYSLAGCPSGYELSKARDISSTFATTTVDGSTCVARVASPLARERRG